MTRSARYGGLDVELSIAKLSAYRESLQRRENPVGGGEWLETGPSTSFLQPFVESIIRRVLPGSPLLQSSRIWLDSRELVLAWNETWRAEAALRAEEELATIMGDDAPRLSAGGLHSWVWEAAQPRWNAGDHAGAVSAAAATVNSRLQQRIDRRDVSERDLVAQAFSDKDPELGKPRLRVPPDDGSLTAQSLQQGVMYFGMGLFQAVRNPLAHQDPTNPYVDLTEQEALERLAAWSLFARWVEVSVRRDAEG